MAGGLSYRRGGKVAKNRPSMVTTVKGFLALAILALGAFHLAMLRGGGGGRRRS